MTDPIEPVDPLVAQPPLEIEPPDADLTVEQKVEWMMGSVVDHLNLHAMAWPARDAHGALVPPPDEHVLDYLARTNELVDEERALTTIPAGTAAVLVDLPKCDLCSQASARYDATFTVREQAGRAYMCAGCYNERGSGSLGPGGDVYLMKFTEVSEWVRGKYNHVAAERGKPPY